MLLRYFTNDSLAHASYLVGCQATGEAMVVDPVRDITPYVETARAEGLRIVAAAETHIHADYVSGARELGHRLGARVYLSGEGGAAYPYVDELDHVLVKDVDTFHIGRLRLEVMHTPGHTPEHVSFVLTDGGAEHPMGIFTGDFVFAGDVGRPDLLEKSVGIQGSAEKGARQMFRSLERFKKLPDYLQVWPAHRAGSACGKSLGAVPSSTVGYEKLFNWALHHKEERAFVEALLEGQPEPPTYFAEMKRMNREGPRLLEDVSDPQPYQADPNKVRTLLDEQVTLLDLRPANRFADGHIPGSINIPFNRSFVQWAGWLVDYERPIVLITAEQQQEEALRQLRSIGLDHVKGIFDLEIVSAWKESGRQLSTYRSVDPETAASKIEKGEVVILDVRTQQEWNEGRIPGARRILLGHLPDQAEKISGDKPVLVHCKAGGRSAIASSILSARGIPVINMSGGFDQWKEKGLPQEKD
jgi:hydroxyacylglutathione hydrolase